MATRYDEQRWRERASRLDRDRKNKHRKKPGEKASSNDILKKAQALDKIRRGEAKSPLSKYEVVPPVKPKLHAFERSSDDDDSWGEGSELSDDDYYLERPKPTKRKHKPHPLPPMNFALVPVQHPGYLGTEKQSEKRQQRKNYLKQKARPSQLREVNSVNHETQTEDDLPAPTRASYYSPPQKLGEPLQRDPRYPYIHLTPDASVHSSNHKLMKEATLRFYEDSTFSTSYVNDFVDSQLQDEIIPDLFIDVLDEMHKQKDSSVEQYNQDRYRPFQLHPYPPNVRTQPVPVGPQVHPLVRQADASKDVMNEFVEQFLQTEIAAVVRESCSDYVQSFVKKTEPDVIMDKLTEAVIVETCQSMFEEIKTDVIIEEFLDEHVIGPLVDDLTIDIATETLEQQDLKQKNEGFKELSGNAQIKFLDGLMLDIMLERIMRQEKVHINEVPVAEFTIDEMALEILLQKMIEVNLSLSEPLDVKPVKRYHEQVVTDVAMDLLLNELCLSLDEDMKDFDEYEIGLTDHLYENGHYET